MNTSLSLATPPNADEAPCTTTAQLAEGPQWLYDTIQPSTAIVHARGAATVIAAANRIIRWVPLGWGWTANVVLEVAHIDWGVGMGPPLNPMLSSEAISLAVELHHIGVDIADIACTTRCLSAAIVLRRPAHPTLCAAARRYLQGCPSHHSRICGRPPARGGHDCRWLSDGQRAITWPSHHDPAHQRHSLCPNGIEVPQR
jgi:hypothetical protein